MYMPVIEPNPKGIKHTWKGDCEECGSFDDCSAYWDGSVGVRIMHSMHVCLSCSHWLAILEAGSDPCSAIVNGRYYTIEPSRPNMPSSHKGFSGQRFLIRFIGGRTVETDNLWFQGTIPKWFWERLPDNATMKEIK